MNDVEKKKHILVVSQYFYPEQFRINDICTEWVKRSYKVTVLTGIPNYPQGKYYEGYGMNSKREEEWNGIRIIRIPLIPRGNSAVGMVANYMSFVGSGFIWQSLTNIEADFVFIFEVSPMTQALVGVWYAKKKKIPCYLYVQDLWPENVEIVTGITNPAIIKPVDKMVKYIYKNCDHVFATSPSFVKEIQKKCDDKEKVSYWPQYAEDFYKPIDQKVAKKNVPEIPSDDSFKIIFTGNIGKAQGLEILPKIAKELKNENIKFIIVGDGREKENFIQSIKDNDVEDMFIMIDKQPATRIPEMLSCCDSAFLSFMDNDLFNKTIPAKLQSYMACGMPIVAVAGGESKRIINEAKCGVVIPIGEDKKFVAKIQELKSTDKSKLKEFGNNSYRYCNDNFNQVDLMNYIDNYFKKEKLL